MKKLKWRDICSNEKTANIFYCNRCKEKHWLCSMCGELGHNENSSEEIKNCDYLEHITK